MHSQRKDGIVCGQLTLDNLSFGEGSCGVKSKDIGADGGL